VDPLRWDDNVSGEFLAELRIEVENRRGAIATIATQINSMGVNIDKISSKDKDYQFTYVDLDLHVESRVHLARIMRRLRNQDGVRRVTRVSLSGHELRTPANPIREHKATPIGGFPREQPRHYFHQQCTGRHRSLLPGREGRQAWSGYRVRFPWIRKP
jgi:hypothetical protein